MNLGGAIKAGRAFVEITGDPTPLDKALGRAKAAMAGFADDVNKRFDTAIAGAQRLQDTIGAIASEARMLGGGALAAGAGIVTPIVGAAVNFGNAGGELKDMAARTGVAVGALQELGYAARMNGATIEEFETGLRRMAKTVVDAGQGGEEATKTLTMLGTSFAELAGLTPEGQFKLIANALDRVRNSTQRADLATSIFGRSGTKLLPMLAGGAAGLREWRDEARNLGIVLSDEAIEQADQFGDALDRLRFVVTSASNAIGSAAVPALMDFVEGATRAGKEVTAWIERNPEFVSAALTFGTGLSILGGGLIGVSIALDAAAYSMKPFILGLQTAQGIVTFALSPLGLLTVGVGALGYAFLSTGNRFEAVSASMRQGFIELWETAHTALRGIGDAIAAGDIELAWQIVTTTMESTWYRALGNMFAALRPFVDGIAMVFEAIATAIENSIQAVAERAIGAVAGLAKLNDRLFGGAVWLAGGANAEAIGAWLKEADARRDAWREGAIEAGDEQAEVNRQGIRDATQAAIDAFDEFTKGMMQAASEATAELTSRVGDAASLRDLIPKFKAAAARGDQGDRDDNPFAYLQNRQFDSTVTGTFSERALSQMAGGGPLVLNKLELANKQREKAIAINLQILQHIQRFVIGA